MSEEYDGGEAEIKNKALENHGFIRVNSDRNLINVK